jgi:hypothetical protein
MRLRLFAAASFAALASLVAGGAQAAVLLMSFGAPVGGSVDLASSQTNTSLEVGPGALSFNLVGVASLEGANFIPAGLSQAGLSQAPGGALDPQAASTLGGDDAIAAPAPAGETGAVIQATSSAKGQDSARGEIGGGVDAKAGAAPDLTIGGQTLAIGSGAPTSFTPGQDLSLTRSGLPAILVPPEVTAVPEPASWALMLVGFGGLGALMRRRRQLAAS